MTKEALHYRKLEHMYLKAAAINSSFYETTTLNIEPEKATITLDNTSLISCAATAWFLVFL